jgi:hypothetical protein
VTLIEDEFGIMVAADRFGVSDTEGLQSVTMHETGHALGVGWADDTPITFLGLDEFIPKGFEVYSNDEDGDGFESDETIEDLPGLIDRWSIMGLGDAEDVGTGPMPLLAYSIEELSTIEFDTIPSKDG